MSQKQMTSSMAIAGAVMGSVLALFLITVFTIVLITARKAPPPTYTDKVIDLPPTHKPPPPYTERPPAIPLASQASQAPQVASFSQARQTERGYELAERAGWLAETSRAPLTIHCPIRSGYVMRMARQMERGYELAEHGRVAHRDLQSPTHHSLSYQEWICHENGADQVYINHREHYV